GELPDGQARRSGEALAARARAATGSRDRRAPRRSAMGQRRPGTRAGRLAVAIEEHARQRGLAGNGASADALEARHMRRCASRSLFSARAVALLLSARATTAAGASA